jgi:hypothetical protein
MSSGATPLTVTWFQHKSTGRKAEIEQLKSNVRTFFWHMKRDYSAVTIDMLWACCSDYKDELRHSEFD